MKLKVLASARVQISIICLGLLCQVSCTKNYPNINTDRNTIATIGPAELPFLFVAKPSWRGANSLRSHTLLRGQR